MMTELLLSVLVQGVTDPSSEVVEFASPSACQQDSCLDITYAYYGSNSVIADWSIFSSQPKTTSMGSVTWNCANQTTGGGVLRCQIQCQAQSVDVDLRIELTVVPPEAEPRYNATKPREVVVIIDPNSCILEDKYDPDAKAAKYVQVNRYSLDGNQYKNSVERTPRAYFLPFDHKFGDSSKNVGDLLTEVRRERGEELGRFLRASVKHAPEQTQKTVETLNELTAVAVREDDDASAASLNSTQSTLIAYTADQINADLRTNGVLIAGQFAPADQHYAVSNVSYIKALQRLQNTFDEFESGGLEFSDPKMTDVIEKFDPDYSLTIGQQELAKGELEAGLDTYRALRKLERDG